MVHCCCLVPQSCLTFCNHMDYSMPGFPVFHCLPEFAQMSVEFMMPSNHLILITLFSSCPQFFPASGSFPMSWLFESGGWSIGASGLASVLPMNIWGWFPNYLSAVREGNKSKNWSLKLSDVKILQKWNNQQKGLKMSSIR